MNRVINNELEEVVGVPRAHGDEPRNIKRLLLNPYVFPVPTGMNRMDGKTALLMNSVPRAHGDEPLCLLRV